MENDPTTIRESRSQKSSNAILFSVGNRTLSTTICTQKKSVAVCVRKRIPILVGWTLFMKPA